MSMNENGRNSGEPPEVWENDAPPAGVPDGAPNRESHGLNYFIREEPAMPPQERTPVAGNGTPYGAPNPGYGGQGGYPPNPGYGGQGGYPPNPGYGGQGGYPPNPGYGGQGGYPPNPGYGGQGGYPPNHGCNDRPQNGGDGIPPAYNDPVYGCRNQQPQPNYRQGAPQSNPCNAPRPPADFWDDQKRKTCSILSFIFGLVSIVIMWIPVLSWIAIPIAIAAVPLGVTGKGGKRSLYGFGIAGMTLGIATLVIYAVAVVICLAFFGTFFGALLHG